MPSQLPVPSDADGFAPAAPNRSNGEAARPPATVGSAAAHGPADLPSLAAAWKAEADPTARTALAAALCEALPVTGDHFAAEAVLGSDYCTDVIRCDVARRTRDPSRRNIALASINDQQLKLSSLSILD